MNLKLIQKNIIDFKKDLQKQKLCEIDWLYEKQLVLGHHHLLTSENLEQWLSILFSSEKTQRFWSRDEIRSSELMLNMARHNADMVATAFRDLFDETRELEGRVDRFKFYVDELIASMRHNSRDFIESWHHQDNGVISYYLMMQYPEKYIYYYPILHQKIVSNLGAKPLSEVEDLPRFQKMAKTLSTFLFRDDELVLYHNNRFPKEINTASRLLVYEFMLFINDH